MITYPELYSHQMPTWCRRRERERESEREREGEREREREREGGEEWWEGISLTKT